MQAVSIVLKSVCGVIVAGRIMPDFAVIVRAMRAVVPLVVDIGLTPSVRCPVGVNAPAGHFVVGGPFRLTITEYTIYCILSIGAAIFLYTVIHEDRRRGSAIAQRGRGTDRRLGQHA